MTMTPRDHTGDQDETQDWQQWAKKTREESDHLSNAVQRMNEVIERQLTYLSPTHAASRAVDIRRRQAIRYSTEHDKKHGAYLLVRAARALLDKAPDAYPWPEQAQELIASPDRLLHAAALLMAAYDAGLR